MMRDCGGHACDEVRVTSSYRENNESDMDALVDALVASINKKYFL